MMQRGLGRDLVNESKLDDTAFFDMIEASTLEEIEVMVNAHLSIPITFYELLNNKPFVDKLNARIDLMRMKIEELKPGGEVPDGA
jgi:hypothetical protein